MSSDRVLEYLVQQIEETGVGFGITLCMHGLVVYGNMIRSKRYYDLMFKNVGNKSNMSDLTQDSNEIKIVDNYYEHYKQFMQDMMKYSEIDSFQYVHLENAIIKLSTESKPIITAAWRGKISSIDAFSLGYGEIPNKE